MFAVLLAGIVSVFSFSPYDYWWLIFPALTVLMLVLPDTTPRKAFFYGWLYGLGLFGYGLFWLRISMLQYGNLPELLAISLALLFAALLALLPACSAYLFSRFSSSNPLLQALQIASFWTLFEWIRSWLFTGFPWLSLGYTQTESPLAVLAPVIGVLGLSFVVVFSAALFAILLRQSLLNRLSALALLLVISALVAIMPRQWVQVSGEPFQVSLIQANIPQQDKWQAGQFMPTLDLYEEMTDDVVGESELVIWPETAMPTFLQNIDQQWLKPKAITWQRRGSQVLTGIVINNPDGSYMNSLFKPGIGAVYYAKQHLVPFGEYVPLAFALKPIIDSLHIPMANFSEGQTASNMLMLNGKINAGVSICYEDIFPNLIRQSLPAANILINVSNDAWFGDSEAPWQHTQMARMRAMEHQRYMLRATNTGVSAVIDPSGKVLEMLGVNEEGTVTANVSPMSGATPYSTFGDLPLLLLIALVVVGALLSSFRRSRLA